MPYLGFPGRKWFSHLLLFSVWVYWLGPHHISGQGLLLFCQTRSSLFRRVNTHPWPACLNEPGSPHVPQKCHCVVSPRPFFPLPPSPPSSPSTQCDFCIRCHGDAAKREENESANLWLPGQTVHLGRVNCTLAVCLCADNGGTRKKVKKGQCDTLSNTMQNTETSYRWC